MRPICVLNLYVTKRTALVANAALTGALDAHSTVLMVGSSGRWRHEGGSAERGRGHLSGMRLAQPQSALETLAMARAVPADVAVM